MNPTAPTTPTQQAPSTDMANNPATGRPWTPEEKAAAKQAGTCSTTESKDKTSGSGCCG